MKTLIGLLALGIFPQLVLADGIAPSLRFPGNVKFVGAILASPCSLQTDNLDQSVDLGMWSAALIKETGQGLAPKTFKLQLNDCLVGSYSQQHILRNQHAVADHSFSITFNAAPESNNKKFFESTGSAQGMAIRLSDREDRLIEPNQKINYLQTIEGQNELVFNAQAVSLHTPVVAGSMQSIVGVEINYQ